MANGNGRVNRKVLQKRFKTGRDIASKLVVGRTPNLRKADGRGRIMRISEAERRAISRSRKQDRNLGGLRIRKLRPI